MKDLLITLLNTAFWVGLHFGTAGVFCALPKDVQTQWFDPNRRFFTVSDWEMRVFRKIVLPKWKDRLPQFNPEFDKRHLKSGRDTAYLDRFLFITCRAEVIHYVIGVLFAAVLLALVGQEWVQGPTFAPALLAGLVSVAAPFCILQPAWAPAWPPARRRIRRPPACAA